MASHVTRAAQAAHSTYNPALRIARGFVGSRRAHAITLPSTREYNSGASDPRASETIGGVKPLAST